MKELVVKQEDQVSSNLPFHCSYRTLPLPQAWKWLPRLPQCAALLSIGERKTDCWQKKGTNAECGTATELWRAKTPLVLVDDEGGPF